MKNKNYACTAVVLTLTVVLTLLLIFLPKEEYSENEKRVLSQLPEFSFTNLVEGKYTKELESYISDHFPLRDMFVGINSYMDQLWGRGNQNGVYLLEDGSLVAEPGNGGTVDAAKLERYMNMFNSFSEKMGIDASLMLVPTPGYMKEHLLPSYHLEYYDEELYKVVENNIGKLNYVDIRQVFENKEGIYYNTDHHVTGYGSYLMYQEYCRSVGIESVGQFSVKESYDGFYGTNYSKSGLWLTENDKIDLYCSDDDYKYKVTIDDLTKKESYDSLFFYDHLDDLDKYPLFLDGNHPVVTIENQSNQNGKKLIIIKDSYAHCFSTMVCREYQTVIMVDLRYYRGAVSQLINDNGINEMLFLFGIENAASISDIVLLR